MAQADVILAALLTGRAISKLDAFKMGAGLSINSRIADLRKQGHDIRCEVVRVNGRSVWRYRLVGQAELALKAGAQDVALV